jgi:hypothetical protein
MSEVKGGCLCGAIRYTLKTAPNKVVVCHCTHCQKSSGSAFSVNVIVAEADMAFEGEPLASYDHTADSGNILNRKFCRVCGSSLGSINTKGRPGMFVLKAGSLDDHSGLRDVGAQLWTRSRGALGPTRFRTRF